MFFKKRVSASSFWKWFAQHTEGLENILDDKTDSMRAYEQLSKKIRRFHRDLVAEMTKDQEGYVLILTPDGRRSGIKAVQELAAAAPAIPKWKVKRFRQAQDQIKLSLGGLELDIADIKVWREFDEKAEMVELNVFIKGYDESDSRFGSLTFLYLDHILGEFNLLTRVGPIAFWSWEELPPNVETVGLLVLRKEIEEKLY